MTFYQQKMEECLQLCDGALDAGDTDKQAEHMREYLNYECMSKMSQKAN